MSIRLLALALCLAGAAPAHAASASSSRSKGTAAPATMKGKSARTSARPAGGSLGRTVDAAVKAGRTQRAAIKTALQMLINARNANSLVAVQPPLVKQIKITATRQGPFGTTVVDFDAKVEQDWFTGGHVTLKQDGKKLVAASTPMFDNPWVDRNVAYGDNSLESVQVR
jgi:hypothetical protein